MCNGDSYFFTEKWIYIYVSFICIKLKLSQRADVKIWRINSPLRCHRFDRGRKNSYNAQIIVYFCHFSVRQLKCRRIVNNTAITTIIKYCPTGWYITRATPTESRNIVASRRKGFIRDAFSAREILIRRKSLLLVFFSADRLIWELRAFWERGVSTERLNIYRPLRKQKAPAYYT